MLLAILLDLFVVSRGQGAYGDYGSAPDDYVPPGDYTAESSGGGVYTDYDHKHSCRYGFIQMYYGDRYDLPYGWQMCDGTNKTPNLQDRFPVGVGDKFKYGGKPGGSCHIKLEIDNLPKHNHELKDVKVSKSGEHGHTAKGTIGKGGAHSHDKGTLETKVGGKHDHEFNAKTTDGAHGHSFDLRTDEKGAHNHGLNIDTNPAGEHGHKHDLTVDKGGEHKHEIKINLYGVEDYYQNVECEDIIISQPDHTHDVGGYKVNDHVFTHGHKTSGTTSKDGAHKHGIDAESTPSGKHDHDFKLTTDPAGAHNHDSGDLVTQAGGNHNHRISEKETSVDGDHDHEVKAYFESMGDYSDELVDIAIDKVDSTTGHSINTGAAGDHNHIVPECETDSAGKHQHLIEGNTGECGNHEHNVIGEIDEAGEHTHKLTCDTQDGGLHGHTTSGTTDDVTITLAHVISGSSGPSGSFDFTVQPKCSITNSGHSHYAEATCAKDGAHDHTLSGNIHEAGEHKHTIDDQTNEAGAHEHGITGTIGSDGDHEHDISGTTSEDGEHNHEITGETADCGDHSHDITITISEDGGHTHDITGSTTYVGEGKPIDVTPPFYAVYFICCTNMEGGGGTYVSSPEYEEPEYVPPSRY